MVVKDFFKIFIRSSVFFVLFVFATPASACVIQLPDCNIFPNHPFCPRPTPSPTPVPTPVVTPEPELPPDPIVFVPGIVASYNRRVLFKDKTGGSWNFVPFGNIYKGLIKRLELAGYEYGDDFFIAFYDWRHSNVQSAEEYLAPIIAEAKQHSASGKVDIVAHSMGGLLVQEYLRNDESRMGEIDQFIMLGTPNAGASDAYLPWEGGVMPRSWDQSTKFYIDTLERTLKKVRGIDYAPPLSYREFFPSLRELLPTESFLVKDGEEIVGGEQNDFLTALRSAYDNLFNAFGISITTIAGNNEQTLGTITLAGPQTPQDILLDRWRDGHPQEEVPSPNNAFGDATVLTSSALLGQHDITLDNVTHTALPEAAQDEVLATLGIVDNHAPQFIYQEPQWLTGFVVLSPVDIVITDEHGNIVSKDTNSFGEDAFVDISDDESADDPKIIILQNLPQGTYTVHVTGTDTGPYTVITTHTDDESSESETLTGETTLGKEELFTVTIGEGGSGMNVSDITPDNPTPEVEVVAPAPRSSGEERSGGRGDERDCCPGSDTVSKKVSKGKVLGATTKKGTSKKGPVTLEELKPLNDVFFSVYGRMPTLLEWKYWVKRYSTDKRDWEKIRGAMYWHKARP